MMTGGADGQGKAGERFHTVAIGGRCGRPVGGGSGRRDAEELSAAGQLLSAMASTEEAVIADAVKARRQDVEQEPADEFAGGERHRLVRVPRVGAVILCR